MEGKNHSFHLTPLTDKDIEAMGLSLSDVWMLRTPSGQSIGPFSTETLKEDSKERPAFYEECELYNMVAQEWRAFYTLPEFQRRKPRLVPAQNLIKNDQFLVLEAGQKTGPFSLEELKQRVQQKQVSLNQEISVDQGKTWIKLYEHHAFDRRARVGQEELPFQPSTTVFAKADEKITTKVLSMQKEKEEQSLMSGLAFIGRGNDKGQRIIFHKASEKDETSEGKSLNERARSTYKIKLAAAASFVILLAGSLFISFSGNQQTPHLGQTPVQDTKVINNSDRSLRERKPASSNGKRSAPVQTTKPRRYVPPARKTPSRPVVRERAPRVQERDNSKRISHSYEDFESLDIDDPKVRAELTRDLAGDYYDEQDRGYDDYDSKGEYKDELPEAGGNDYYDAPARKQAEPEYSEEDPYEGAPNDGAYEEYGDFE